jgi:hypothetical protein
MFFFGPLHVLFVYGFKRFSDILERDHAVFEEIQRRANLVPPAQRQATIDALRAKANLPQLRREVFIQEQKKIQAEAASNRRFWTIWWIIAITLYFIFGFVTTFWIAFAWFMIQACRAAASCIRWE